jgi:protein phosphatase PTC1
MMAAADGTHSGCTAVTAFLRLEDEQGNPVGDAAGVGKAVETKEGELQGDAEGALKAAQAGEGTELQRMRGGSGGVDPPGTAGESPSTRTDIKNKIKAVLTGKSGAEATSTASETGSRGGSGASTPEGPGVATPTVQVNGPAEVKRAAKRTLYTANVGDARAVLGRGGRAVRLTYDHKGSDAKEAKRITDAGGFVMNNRVNGE